MEVLFAFLGALLGVLGGIGVAHRLLSKAVDQRISDQNNRIEGLETTLGNHTREINDRLNREYRERVDKDSEHREARGNLGQRIALLENEFRRWLDGGQAK